MRIIAGRFGGKKLCSPQDKSIRPTSDRVREALFNILASRLGMDFSAIKVLDLFAGTGAMGFEAISRGATEAVFVDSGVQARSLIRSHIEMFGLGAQARLLRRDATSLGLCQKIGPFNLVFCDPPYGLHLGEKALGSAAKGSWIAPGALVLAEEDRQIKFAIPPGFSLLDQRDYGNTSVRFFTFEGI